MKLLKTICLSFIGVISSATHAQDFDASIQLRPRYEYRNGYKSLLKTGDSPTSFISQRSRLNLNFEQDKLKLKLSLQNVRTWGDVATTTTADKNGVAVFEAYADYSFDDKWSARLGRQVLSYDNQRIMGGIDWIQQGQSHDAALITYKDAKNRLDLGFAHNANAENLLEPTTAYTTTYKEMQYAWYHTSIKKVNASFLFLNAGYQYLKTPTDLQTDYIQTYGTYLTYKGKKWDFDLGIYGQSGKSGHGQGSHRLVPFRTFTLNFLPFPFENYRYRYIGDTWFCSLNYCVKINLCRLSKTFVYPELPLLLKDL